MQNVGVNIPCHTLRENVRASQLVSTDTTSHVSGRAMMVVAFDSTMRIIKFPLIGISCIVEYIVGTISRYTLSWHCNSDPCVRIQLDISDSQLGLELSPEVMTSTLTVWRTLHTEGAYRYHIQFIRHLEHANMCNGLELRRWINFNPIWFVTICSSTRPTQGEHERRTIPAKSQRCKKHQQLCSAS